MATPEVHQLLVDTVTHEHDCVLQYDSERQALRFWLWPREHSGAVVPPEKLCEHRTSHDFLGPCCFCPAMGCDDRKGFAEAAMFDRGGREFVALCPTDSCSYLVLLSRIFEKGRMPTATYRKRGDGTIEPPPVYHQSEDTKNVFRKVHFEGCELSDTIPDMRPTCRVLPRPIGYSELLDKLDSRVRPGIAENTMKHLFVKCKRCGKVTTRRVFLYHAW
ncbi:hypothetical protein V8D89_012105 [Ganoderma adspersum]